MTKRPSSWTDDLDNVSARGGYVGNIRTIDPRMAGAQALLAAGAHHDGGPGTACVDTSHVAFLDCLR